MPPFPVEKAKDAIRAELGSSVEELYGSFNDVPLAAASIAQVHRATLKDGTEVVITNGEIVSGYLDGTLIGEESGSLIRELHKKYGNDRTSIQLFP